MKKGFATIIVLLIILALIGVGVVAYIHYIYLPKLTGQNNDITTSGWRIYHNTKYGYAISYPSDAQIQASMLQENDNAPGGIESSPADSPSDADVVSITINTSTYPDILTDASVTIIPLRFYIGTTGLGIGDKIVSSTFILNGTPFPASGVDSSLDDGSIYMGTQVGQLDIYYEFGSANGQAINEPEFSDVQNALLSIIKTFSFGSSSEKSAQ